MPIMPSRNQFWGFSFKIQPVKDFSSVENKQTWPTHFSIYYFKFVKPTTLNKGLQLAFANCSAHDGTVVPEPRGKAQLFHLNCCQLTWYKIRLFQRKFLSILMEKHSGILFLSIRKQKQIYTQLTTLKLYGIPEHQVGSQIPKYRPYSTRYKWTSTC